MRGFHSVYRLNSNFCEFRFCLMEHTKMCGERIYSLLRICLGIVSEAFGIDSYVPTPLVCYFPQGGLDGGHCLACIRGLCGANGLDTLEFIVRTRRRDTETTLRMERALHCGLDEGGRSNSF